MWHPALLEPLRSRSLSCGILEAAAGMCHEKSSCTLSHQLAKLLGVDPTQSIDVSKAKLFLSGGDTVDVADLAADDTVYIAFRQLRLRPGLSPLP